MQPATGAPAHVPNFKITPLIRKTIDNFLEKNSKLEEADKEMLKTYENQTLIKFSDLQQIVSISALDTTPVYLHQLLQGSCLVPPEIKKAELTPEQEARKAKLRQISAELEYSRLVSDIEPMIYREVKPGNDFRSALKQASAPINMFLSCFAAWLFGYIFLRRFISWEWAAGIATAGSMCLFIVEGFVFVLQERKITNLGEKLEKQKSFPYGQPGSKEIQHPDELKESKKTR